MLVHILLSLLTLSTSVRALGFLSGCCCSCGMAMPQHCGCQKQTVCPPPLPCLLPTCPICITIPPPCPLPPLTVCPAPQPITVEQPCTCTSSQGGGYLPAPHAQPIQGGNYAVPNHESNYAAGQFQVPGTSELTQASGSLGEVGFPPVTFKGPLGEAGFSLGALSNVIGNLGNGIVQPPVVAQRFSKTFSKQEDNELSSRNEKILKERSEIASNEIDEEGKDDVDAKNEVSVMVSETKCNSEQLMDIISKNIVDDDAVKSKRAIHSEAIKEIGSGIIDVICSVAEFTYIVSADEYCEAQKGLVVCFAYKKNVDKS